jgi:hypothetical protein
MLQEEYVFISVVSSYLRAICTGAIHVRHGAVLLAYYGRLGTTFDLCVKALIDVLRDEGMLQGNGAIVSDVVVQALRDVSMQCITSIPLTYHPSLTVILLRSRWNNRLGRTDRRAR